MTLTRRAVSGAYQDLFQEGSFIGKGIYDVDAFERAVGGKFPANRILSHDLLESTYARSGLVTDVILFEEFPARYAADIPRRTPLDARGLAKGICNLFAFAARHRPARATKASSQFASRRASSGAADGCPPDTALEIPQQNHVRHQSRSCVAAFEQVMTEDSVLRKSSAHGPLEGIHIVNALADGRAFLKQVLINIGHRAACKDQFLGRPRIILRSVNDPRWSG